MSLAKRLKRLWKLSETDFDFTPEGAPKKKFFEELMSYKAKQAKIVDMADPLDIDLGEK